MNRGRRAGVIDRQRRLAVSPAAVESLVDYVFESERRDGRVSVVLVDDAIISDLHARFLGDPTPTDVLTFPAASAEDGTACVADAGGLGEIVVSTESAARQAPRYGNDPVREVLLCVVHGALHLLGYDDAEARARRRMARRQNAILTAWENTRRASGA